MLHQYKIAVSWTGNLGTGTSGIKAYERDHVIRVDGKSEIAGTSEVSVQANKVRYNPEELLVSAVSACHMMWFLYLCARDGVIVTAYTDAAEGRMESAADGGGHFTGITLKPTITIAGSAGETQLHQLHEEAHRLCYIASSCNFPITHEPNYLNPDPSGPEPHGR